MVLTDSAIQDAFKAGRAAFPHLTNWEHNNEKNDFHNGFALWGEYILDPTDTMRSTYFVTFCAYQDTWRGYWTIGQHAYFWSSTEVGDAYLLSTDACATLADAAMALKADMAKLLQAFSAV
jgi:hypothetical protein